MSKVPFNFSGDTLTIMLSYPRQVHTSHKNYRRIRAMLKNDSIDEVVVDRLIADTEPDEPAVKPVATHDIKDGDYGEVTVVNGQVCYNGEPIESSGLTERVAALQAQDLPFDGMLKFIARLFNNVSFRVRKELLNFIDRNGLVIDSDGNIIFYKAVAENYLDKYSRTIDNSPGQTIRMDRAKVDDDHDVGCSKGLHCGSLEYIYWYGGGSDRIILVKVSPENVVCVPKDCDCKKVRVCEYYVMGDYNGELQKVSYEAKASAEDLYEDFEEYNDDDEWSWEEVSDEYEDDDMFDVGDVVSLGCDDEVENARNYIESLDIGDCDGDCDCDDEDDCDEDYGLKPSGVRYWNNRGPDGRFAPSK